VQRLEDLSGNERVFKEDIHGTQRHIAKLEIKNNLLRKEIHNSQFERIKLLKQYNEIKNKIDEVKWVIEENRKKILQIKDPKNNVDQTESKKDFKMPPTINSEEGYRKCLLAESTLQSKQLREFRLKN